MPDDTSVPPVKPEEKATTDRVAAPRGPSESMGAAEADPGRLLGRLETVDPRTVWKHEAHDFTRWLLKNADVLGEALGMDLELTEAEHKVGGFALDLIGTDLSTGDRVIVENQLDATDHTHLGQLLTYAGGTSPTTIVWCAPRFRDEHRAALAWLNERTSEETRFFGVEIGVVRIGASPPAPLFRLVAQPNDWGKQVRSSTTGPNTLTPRAALYQRFWGRMLERLQTEHPTWTRSTIPTTASWTTLPAGTTIASYGYSFTATRALRSELYFGSQDAAANRAAFDRLAAVRPQFEDAYGQPLSWQPLEGKKACRIADDRPNSPIEDTDSWEDYISWLFDAGSRIRHALRTIGGLAGQEG
ncbi:DUF4268 domain-containing protein [Asanoa sp. NPDC049518]|uniref:DUF4268 domain-containing protein n=1 Tax=unclassified Asanoa TaxID=2685164 RepID=UPI00344461F2